MAAGESIGDRVASIRNLRGHTQEELAERSGVAVTTIRKLERGERTTARMATLHKLAAALGTTTSDLLRPSPKLAGPPSEPDASTVMALRCALTPPRTLAGVLGDGGEPPSLSAVNESLRHAQDLLRSSELSAAVEAVSSLLAELRLATSAADGGEEQVQLHTVDAKVHQLVASVLIQLRLFDLAYLALDRAMDAADSAGDQILGASTVSNLIFLLLRQGRLEEAQRVATTTADQIEPQLSSAPPRHIAAWGWLLLGASAAAVRNNQPDQATEALALARSAAVRFTPYPNGVGAPFGPTRVMIQDAENAVIMGHPDRALGVAERVQYSPSSPATFWCRHLLDVACAQTELRQYGEATETLLRVYAAVPEWLIYQRYAKEIVTRLVKARKRSLGVDLRTLADHLRIDA